MKINELIYDICKNVIGIIFFIFLTALFLYSGFSTSIFGESIYTVYFIKDSFLLNLFFSSIVLFIGYIIHRKIQGIFSTNNKMSKYWNYANIIKLLLWFVFIVGIVYILSTQLCATSDQEQILQAAGDLRNNKYDTFVKPTGYIRRYNHQIGIVVFLYALGSIFGDKNAIVFQIINVFTLVGIYKCFIDLCEYLKFGKMAKIFLVILLMLFFPFSMYVTFVYGTLLGFYSSLIAIKYMFKFFQNDNAHNLLFCSLAIGFATMIKSNFFISMIAIIIIVVMKAIKEKRPKIMLLVFAIAVSAYLFSSLPKAFVEHKIGQPIEKGASAYSFVAMGLQERKTGSDSNVNRWGGYNTYVYGSFKEANFDADLQKQIAIDNIKQTLTNFKENKKLAVSAISNKLSWAYNNPMFESFSIQRKPTNIRQPLWIEFFTSKFFEIISCEILSLYQFFLLMTSLIEIILGSKDYKDNTLIFKLIFIGGFIFHLFWEIRGQYTILYFVLLFPLSVGGVKYLYNFLDNVRENSRLTFADISSKSILTLCFVCVSVLAVYFNGDVRSVFALDMGTELYKQYRYINLCEIKINDDNYYQISPYADKELYLSLDTKNKNNAHLSDKPATIRIFKLDDDVLIKFEDNGYYLDLQGNKEGDYVNVQSYRLTVSEAQKWRIEKPLDKDYSYLFIDSERALTYDKDTGELFVKTFDGGDEQKFIILNKKIN